MVKGGGEWLWMCSWGGGVVKGVVKGEWSGYGCGHEEGVVKGVVKESEIKEHTVSLVIFLRNS